ncbi:related to tRNA (uracil-O(2)-)-methyltransferase [Saccharomycodes ludwigii]|uniref:tRNA (uracil-O(2)-)-methyltransferase n=1 Tax=Saccharomycodes ludwigii TaxID=36035 RepID=A0A376B297_9ASCO|nr:hypothetical protein SCDLUD_001949 [Saccharomycodes ludwigii]KAH3902136.1 hypothetical protein SCDLUD_001949 [Saccharomycodes ludwigii]SSD58604.1 related to tRNA (uracil-O(2)-)-methyltransferase [Saccharomycodes ludwigii]
MVKKNTNNNGNNNTTASPTIKFVSKHELNYNDDPYLPKNITRDDNHIEDNDNNNKWICLYEAYNTDNKSSISETSKEDIPQKTNLLPFGREHFIQAMENVIKHPNINSTIILRSDILVEMDSKEVPRSLIDKKTDDFLSESAGAVKNNSKHTDETFYNTKDITDINIRKSYNNNDYKTTYGIVRRIIPRNPLRDPVINQTCLLMENSTNENCFIIYTPHIQNEEDCPFYIPKVKSVGILYTPTKLKVFYIPFSTTKPLSIFQDELNQRIVRTALRLLQTAYKHSNGRKNGYTPKVKHDLVVSKLNFQNKYIELKQKYGKWLVDNWAESTDPKKHVFEDIAIASFLIELWKMKYTGNNFQFRDLGCGNGVLCYILIMEGYIGVGIDARKRKSWNIYPVEVQKCLKEQVIVPSILLRPNRIVPNSTAVILDATTSSNNNNNNNNNNNDNSNNNNTIFPSSNGRYFTVPARNDVISSNATIVYSSDDLLQSSHVNTAEFPENTFLIGNHSDELTCWIPLLGYPFMVIPCCSHAFSGAKIRYKPSAHGLNGNNSSSTYAGLVAQVIRLAKQVGWDPVEKEMLRIPSTRNAAIIGITNKYIHTNNVTSTQQQQQQRADIWPNKKVYDVIMENGGADGWVEHTMALMR